MVVRIANENYQSLTKWDLNGASDAQYTGAVNAFRNQTVSPLSGYDVVFGPVAKYNGAAWVKNTSGEFPLQYKFESVNAASKIEIVGLVPLEKFYY